MNCCVFAGNLTRDPEIRSTGNGKIVCNFAIAVNGRGEKDETLFVDCVAWERTGEVIEEYCRKGQRLTVQGPLKVEKYRDRDDNPRQKIVLTVQQVTLPPRSDSDRSERREEPREERRERREPEDKWREEKARRQAREERDPEDGLPF